MAVSPERFVPRGNKDKKKEKEKEKRKRIINSTDSADQENQPSLVCSPG
jgi:hypothetical protein